MGGSTHAEELHTTFGVAESYLVVIRREMAAQQQANGAIAASRHLFIGGF